jgi:hypothetical protein
VGNLSGFVGPKIYSALAVCAYADGSRTGLGAACPSPSADACPGFPADPYAVCPWDTSYVFGHATMAACSAAACLLAVIIRLFVRPDTHVRWVLHRGAKIKKGSGQLTRNDAHALVAMQRLGAPRCRDCRRRGQGAAAGRQP